MGSITKEFHRLLRRIGKLSDGQATIENIDWEGGSLQKFNVVLRPNSGVYGGGIFEFEIAVSDCTKPPLVYCLTDIYHPNIDTSESRELVGDNSNICLNVLDNPYNTLGLDAIILGLIFLMKYPNLEDPLSPMFEGYDDNEEFEEKVKAYMSGEEVDGQIFDTKFRVIDGITTVIEKTDSKIDNGATAEDTVAEAVKVAIEEAKRELSENTNTNSEKVADPIQTVANKDIVEGILEGVIEATVCSDTIDESAIGKDNETQPCTLLDDLMSETENTASHSNESETENTIGQINETEKVACESDKTVTETGQSNEFGNEINQPAGNESNQLSENETNQPAGIETNQPDTTEPSTVTEDDVDDDVEENSTAIADFLVIGDEYFLVYGELDQELIIDNEPTDNLPYPGTEADPVGEDNAAEGESASCDTDTENANSNTPSTSIDNIPVSNEVTTKCQTLTVIRIALIKLLYLFSCSVRAYKRFEM